MTNPEFRPNDPELFEQLAVNLDRLTGESDTVFVVDDTRYDYPRDPNNLFRMGDSIYPKSIEIDERDIAGRAMYASAQMEIGGRQDIGAYALEETKWSRYRRLGELTVSTPLLSDDLTLDIHRLLISGVVLTSSDPDHDKLRRLEDFELVHLVEVTGRATPAW